MQRLHKMKCIKCFSTLLRKVEGRGDILGIKVCKGALILSHLLFANDYFLFCRAIDSEVETLHAISASFEKSYGLVVNFAKSKCFFRKNTYQNVQDNILGFLGVFECIGTSKYLGIPSMVGRKRKTIFNYLRDGIWKKGM